MRETRCSQRPSSSLQKRQGHSGHGPTYIATQMHSYTQALQVILPKQQPVSDVIRFLNSTYFTSLMGFLKRDSTVSLSAK